MARMLIKVEGNSRPSVVNILEGPRSFELQIWWEISPWVIGVYPVSSRDEKKNPEVEDDVETRAGKRVSSTGSKCSQVGQWEQWEQAGEAKKKKRLGAAESSSVHSTLGALMRGRGGTYSEICWNKKDGLSVLGMGPIQQAGNGGRTNAWVGFLPGLKEKEFNGPRARSRRSPDGLKIRSGLKEGLKRQKEGAHITTYWAANMGSESGPVLYGMQVGPPNDVREEKAGKRGPWGRKKSFKEAGLGPSGDVTGSKGSRRLEEGVLALAWRDPRNSWSTRRGFAQGDLFCIPLKVCLVRGELQALRAVGRRGRGWCRLSA